MQEGSLFSTAPPALVICGFINDGHSDGCEVISHGSFDLHFSYASGYSQRISITLVKWNNTHHMILVVYFREKIVRLWAMERGCSKGDISICTCYSVHLNLLFEYALMDCMCNF